MYVGMRPLYVVKGYVPYHVVMHRLLETQAPEVYQQQELKFEPCLEVTSLPQRHVVNVVARACMKVSPRGLSRYVSWGASHRMCTLHLFAYHRLFTLSLYTKKGKCITSDIVELI